MRGKITMAKKIFLADKEVELLIDAYTKDTGVSIAKLLNNVVRQAFSPTNMTLAVESAYLLQQAAVGKADQDLIKQCISRGIHWLGSYPVESPKLLQRINSHFTRAPWGAVPDENYNDSSTLFDDIIARIKDVDSTFAIKHPIHPFYGNFGEEILSRWDMLWQDRAAYDALSAIVYSEEPAKPLNWYDGILTLQSIEAVAIEKYGIK